MRVFTLQFQMLVMGVTLLLLLVGCKDAVRSRAGTLTLSFSDTCAVAVDAAAALQAAGVLSDHGLATSHRPFVTPASFVLLLLLLYRQLACCQIMSWQVAEPWLPAQEWWREGELASTSHVLLVSAQRTHVSACTCSACHVTLLLSAATPAEICCTLVALVPMLTDLCTNWVELCDPLHSNTCSSLR
jgi:hypothetical protein